MPLIPHHLSGSILSKSDQFMIKRFCGNADLAVYSFAYDCSLVVSILSTSVNQAYVPWLYRKLKENDFSEIDRHARRLFMVGYCFKFLYTYYANLELYCKKSITISVATVIAAGVNVGLNVLWIPEYGYGAAAFTTTIGFAVLYVLHYLATRRTPYHSLYHHKKLLLLVLAFIMCSIGVILLYKNTIIRYCIAIVYFSVTGYATCKFFLVKKE